ncbi:cytochrome P450 93A3-like [Trifolium pratense]|nr:cytochrome P450 93A3-like [Trifolium pratense]
MSFDAAFSVHFYIFSFLALLIFTLIIKNKQTTNCTSKFRPPPTPRSLPIIGHLHLIGSIIPKSFQKISNQYGPLIQLNLGASTSIIVSNAQVAKEVMKTHDLNFCYRPQFGSSNDFLYKGSYFITAPYGPYWRFMKKLCVTKLLSSSQLSRFMHIREQELENLLKYLVIFSNENKSTDLCLDLTTYTNNILCLMTMGTTIFDKDIIRCLVREFMHVGAKLSMGEVFGPLGKLDLFGYGKKLRKIVGEFDKILESFLKEHEERINNEDREGDMMDILLEVYRNPNAEVRLTRNDIKAFFLDILLAGTDTSSVAMQWAMAEIINNPIILNKLRAEIESVVGPTRLIRESDVPKMPYLQACVKEVLRLHPPAPFALRQSSDQDCKINGYDVKAHTRTLINVYAIMRDPKSWVNPEEYIPERFLVSGDEINGGDDYEDVNKMDGGDDFRYIPFGFGRRGCPGSSLALRVIHVTIGALIQCFEWKINGGDKVNMEEGSSFSVGLAKPLVCYPVTCFNPFENCL